MSQGETRRSSSGREGTTDGTWMRLLAFSTSLRARARKGGAFNQFEACPIGVCGSPSDSCGPAARAPQRLDLDCHWPVIAGAPSPLTLTPTRRRSASPCPIPHNIALSWQCSCGPSIAESSSSQPLSRSIGSQTSVGRNATRFEYRPSHKSP